MTNIGAFLSSARPLHAPPQVGPGWGDPSVIQAPYVPAYPPVPVPQPGMPSGGFVPPPYGPDEWPPVVLDPGWSIPGGPTGGWPAGADRIETAPLPAPAPDTSGWRPPVIEGAEPTPAPAPDADGGYSVGELVGGGIKGYVLPYTAVGALGAAFAAGGAGVGASTAIGKVVRGGIAGAIGGLAMGAGTGMAVAATRPDDDSSMALRFGAAGLGLGAAGAAIAGRGTANVVLAGVTGALVGGFTGRDIARQHAAG